MTKALLLLGAVVLAIPCIRGFARWERKGKALRAVVLLLVLELVESALYEDANLVPRGLFHPGAGASQFRLPEIFITVALLGRLVARRMPERIGYPAMLWTAFAAWMTVGLVEGYLRGNSSSQILYEGKAIIYVVGGFTLASAIPIRRFLEAEVFERLTRWFAPLLLLLDVLTAHHTTININIPLLPLPLFGAVGSDAASVFGALGLVALVLELGKEQRSLWTIVCTLPLLFCPVLAPQRATLIGLGAAVIFLLVVFLGPVARRRLRVNMCQILLALSVVIALAILIIIGPAALNQQPPKIPLSSTVALTFNSNGKAESAQDRLNEFAAARRMIPQHWILGWGLGLEYQYWAAGPNVEVTSALTEDIYSDLWLRTGIIGLGVFVAAALVSLRGGLGVWRRHPDRMVAIFALALVAALLTLLVKGGFDSDFENYRLSTLLGLLFGMLRSSVTSAGGGLSSMTNIVARRKVSERTDRLHLSHQQSTPRSR